MPDQVQEAERQTTGGADANRPAAEGPHRAHAAEVVDELRRDARDVAKTARRALNKPGIGAAVAGAAVLAAGAVWGATEAAVAAVAAYVVFRMLRDRRARGQDIDVERERGPSGQRTPSSV